MLKQLMISKKIESARSILNGYLEEEKALKTRNDELEVAITEANTDEEISVVEENIEKLEADQAALEEKKSKLEGEIADLEGELEQLNSKEPKNEPKDPDARNSNNKGDEVRMNRYKFFGGLTREASKTLIEREDVKEFLTRTRELMGQKRAVTGAELTIPEIMLELLRDNLHTYSKLISKVNLKPVSGKARQNIAGAVPEAVWTEMCAKINELDIVFNGVEVDGYKVAGFIAICNATLEDSDLNLANEILTTLAQSLGLGVDKAIIYGKGEKMPVGIVTRLAEATKPAYWGKNEPAWKDLRTTNLLVIDPAADTDVKFYKDLILKLGKVKANYSNGQKLWAMSSNTFAALQARALTINAAGAIVSGQTKTMPIVGGDVVELDFIPDNHIIGGYGSLYLLAERAGAKLAQSEHAQFIEDNTVFKGTARYDGRPVFGEAFVAINISQEDLAAPPKATDVAFAADTANQ
ncbi:phage major capsid protein [Tissierella sp.]|uniref:phage major capsid protein n=1 Tax=Tissierella sp. TaxID=41274 RepID=UPI00305C0677